MPHERGHDRMGPMPPTRPYDGRSHWREADAWHEYSQQEASSHSPYVSARMGFEFARPLADDRARHISWALNSRRNTERGEEHRNEPRWCGCDRDVHQERVVLAHICS